MNSVRSITCWMGGMVLLSSAAWAEGNAPHWEYEGAHGAAHWAKIDKSFAACEEGATQSPIDINQTIDADLPDLNLKYGSAEATIVNNGHTVQANFTAGQSFSVGATQYDLLQFHFHTPSEYHISGQSFPLEMHLVHKSKDGALAVIGVMIAEGAANSALDQFLNNMPTTAKEAPKTAGVALDKLLPADKKYYRFMGSLTTPPCSEGVNWHMMQTSITASKEQIAKFQALYKMNARPLQPSNNRLVVKDNK